MPRRPASLQITLPVAVVDRLRSRGARSDRYHGPLGYTRQLNRTLDLYESVLVKSDPRETRGLAAEHYELIVELIDDPQKLESFHVQRLGQYLAEVAGFAERARAAGIADPEEFARTLDGFSFAEKLHLLDAAQLRHAPGTTGLPGRRGGQ
jgi:hypothetical protein